MGERRAGFVRAGFRRAGTGGGGISKITSTGGSVAITGPTGPTTNLEVPASAPLVAAATWPIANNRWFAVDGATGNDANAGFSDVSGAAAWLVAKKTLAGLAAIFPKFGNGRKFSIAIGGGGQTYTDPLDVLMGTGGWNNSSSMKATATNATAGAVAGADNAADAIFDGAVTATGMNAAGYNPVAAFSATVIKCLTVAAGAPGFAAEPALPCGARIRFDSATTTAALRNICRNIIKVSGGDTLQVPLDAALPAVPVGTDVFYIEMPGVTLSAACTFTQPGSGFNFSGLSFGSTLLLAGAVSNSATGNQTLNFSFCRFVGALTVRESAMGFNTLSLSTGAAGNQTVGGCRCDSTYTTVNARMIFQSSVHVGLVTISNPLAFQMNPQGFVAAGFIQEGFSLPTTDTNQGQPASVCAIGNTGGVTPWRFKAAADCIILRSTRASLGAIAFVGGARGVAMRGPCDVDNMSKVTGSSTGLTVEAGGALTDVGVDMSDATNGLVPSMGSRFIQGLLNVSTATGTNGDIRLGDGTIVTWAQFLAGLADGKGNRIFGTYGPSWSIPLSGFLLGGAGATTSYMSNAGGTAGAVNAPACDYPTSERIINRLRFKAETNTFATTVTATLFKNGVATAITVNIAAGSTAVVSDTAHSVFFVDGDTFAVVLANAADAGKTIVGMAVLEGPS